LTALQIEEGKKKRPIEINTRKCGRGVFFVARDISCDYIILKLNGIL
jgi:hypothetical protein